MKKERLQPSRSVAASRSQSGAPGSLRARASPARELAELRARCGADLEILSGDDPTAADAMLAGATGVISVTANVAPRLMHELCEAALGGDEAATRAIDARLALLHRALFIESNPIPSKWALQQLGLIGPGIRLPLTPLTASSHTPVREAMRAAGVPCV